MWRKPGSFLFILAICLIAISCKPNGKPVDKSWAARTKSSSHFADMGDYKMHYLDIGQGRPLIMIHGFADSTYCWHNNIDTLTKAGMRLILIDQPGCGQSTIPPRSFPMTIDNLSAQVIKLADHLKLEKFSVMGSSMGGGVCLYLLTHHPDRIDRAVVADPVCYQFKPPLVVRLLSDPEYSKQAGMFVSPTIVRFSLRDCYYDKKKVSDTLVGEYARPLAKDDYVELLIRLVTEYESPAADSMIAGYGQIQSPVMILWGDTDRWIPPELAPRLHKAIPGSKLNVVKNAGHLPHQEQPGVVNPLLSAFFKSKGE